MTDETGRPKIDDQSRNDEAVNSPLMAEIDGYASRHNVNDLKRLATKFLPFVLTWAMGNSSGIKQLKAIIEKYPELKPAVVDCALQLRNDGNDGNNGDDTRFRESLEYSAYISSL